MFYDWIIAVLAVSIFLIWYMYRFRFWFRTARCISHCSCLCGWLCCWRHTIRKPPHTGLCAGTGRKSRATHVAICFPHNPFFWCWPTGCHCDPCCDDSIEARNHRANMDAEAHPFGLGCALPCAPLCCIRCCCEDEVDAEPTVPQEQPAPLPSRSKNAPIGAQPVVIAVDDPPPPYQEEDNSKRSYPAVAGPQGIQQAPNSTDPDITPVQAAKVLAKFAVKGVGNLANNIKSVAQGATKKGSEANK